MAEFNPISILAPDARNVVAAAINQFTRSGPSASAHNVVHFNLEHVARCIDRALKEPGPWSEEGLNILTHVRKMLNDPPAPICGTGMMEPPACPTVAPKVLYRVTHPHDVDEFYACGTHMTDDITETWQGSDVDVTLFEIKVERIIVP